MGERVGTWLRSSAGLIREKRLKSMIVICLAISSGSKSKTLSTEDGVSGNCRQESKEELLAIRMYIPSLEAVAL